MASDLADLSTSGPQRQATPPLSRSGRAVAAVRYAAPALLGYAAVRLVGLLMLWTHPGRGSTLTRLGTLWDAVFYLDVAKRGYVDDLGIPGYQNGVPYSSRAFFPVYPGLIRAVDTVLPVSAVHAALLVAWAGALLAAAGIFAIGAHLYGRRAGVVAAVLWGVIPHAVVESYAYTEALFTAAAAWALYAALTRRWVWAGAISTLSCLVRPTGMAVAAAVVVAGAWTALQILRGRGDGATAWWRPLAGAFLAPLGWIGYVGYVGWVRGSLKGYFDVQSAWGSQFDGGVGTVRWLHRLFLGSGGGATTVDQVVMAGVVVAAVLLFAVSVGQRQPLVLLVFSAMMLVIALGDGSDYAPRARFLVPAFALLLPLAAGLARLRQPAARWLVLLTAALCSGVYGVFLTFVSRFSP
ncbi:hypothetical protein [Kitasatospora paranensis]|uniref:Glycosyltransferase RgtA/B/C/D-like domain-containing protein n=1 Tax=Kitasatospora paranensis TaxID=258053 RepID=A0ABW2FVU3_9ACTN